MVSYQYTYFLMGLVFLIIWITIFLLRKDIRKEMIIISIIFALAGPLADIIYTKDWWHPLTLTNTTIGIEALICGFTIGGIASVIYENVFKKRLKKRKISKKEENRKNFNLLFLIVLLAIIFSGSFYILNLNSLFSTVLAFSIPTIIIWIKRKDLITNSLFSGVLLLLISSIVYGVLGILTPRWINTFWYFKNVPNIIILNLPIDDIIWYFFAGAFIGPLYEYWKEKKLANINQSSKKKKKS